MTRDDGYTRYTVRIPDELYERVKNAAGEASVNSKIVEVLLREYPAPKDTAQAHEVIELIKSLIPNTPPTQLPTVERRVNTWLQSKGFVERIALDNSSKPNTTTMRIYRSSVKSKS